MVVTQKFTLLFSLFDHCLVLPGVGIWATHPVLLKATSKTYSNFLCIVWSLLLRYGRRIQTTRLPTYRSNQQLPQTCHSAFRCRFDSRLHTLLVFGKKNSWNLHMGGQIGGVLTYFPTGSTELRSPTTGQEFIACKGAYLISLHAAKLTRLLLRTKSKNNHSHVCIRACSVLSIFIFTIH